MGRGKRPNAWDSRIKPNLKAIAAWYRDGFTEKQIAHKVGVSEATWYYWKSRHPELSESLKINKFMADAEVENALYKRARGYTVTEVVEEVYGTPTGKLDQNGKPIIKHDKVHRKTIKKEIPPDTTAGIFWLKNRQPDKWRDRKLTEVTGSDGGPVRVSTLDDERYKEIRKKMLEESDC